MAVHRHAVGLLSIILIVSIISSLPTAEASKRTRMKPPLIGEEPSRKNRKSADCQFGKQVYELEETWHPDLGPPFGTMYCIRCECIPVQKKKRIAGRTLCRNIKNECPKPQCEEPILLPGHCCKVCPEESLGSGPLKEDGALIKDIDEDDKQSKDFAAILTSGSATNVSSGVATARLSFHKRHLYYSILGDPGLPLPRSLQFLAEDGTILEEQELETNDYYAATGKICGVWRKVSRAYRQLLRDDKLHITLVSEGDAEVLTGRVWRNRALSSETLSALLLPDVRVAEGFVACPGCGGTAAVAMATATNSLYVNVAVTGLVAKSVDSDVIVVRLETSDSGAQPSRVIEEIVAVHKPQEVNVMEIRTVLEPQEMRHLMRRQVILTAWSKRNPELRLRGIIGPRISCDVFDTLISVGGPDPADEGSNPSSPAKGLGWFYIGRNGLFHHHIYVKNPVDPPSSVTIETGLGKNKRRREVENISGSFDSQWINGTFRLHARDYELLYEGELYVNFAGDSESRGRIALRSAGESHLSLKSGPILLDSVNGSRTGLGWVNIDSQCTLHYDVSVRSLKKDHQGFTVLELVDLPKLGLPKNDPAAFPRDQDPEGATADEDKVYLPTTTILEKYNGDRTENIFTDLSKISLTRIAAGGAYLKITEPRVSENLGSEFVGWLTNVRVPESCLPQAAPAVIRQSDLEKSLEKGFVLESRNENEIPQTRHCNYEGKVYQEGSQWNAEHDRCTMCSCQRGRVVCDPVVCPAVTCPAATVVHDPAECCPTCSNVPAKPKSTVVNNNSSSAKAGCHLPGDQNVYPPGSRWHPYLPPFGFNKCVVCSCDPHSLKPNCTRISCPPLTCPESEAFRADPSACCKQCPVPTVPPTPDPSSLVIRETLDEEAKEKSEAEILQGGGCRFKGDVYDNGEEWHPRIQPWGEMKCINCVCKDGQVKCKRKKCPSTKCSSVRASSSASDGCCPACPADSSSAGPSSKGTANRNPVHGSPASKKTKSRDDRSKVREPKTKRTDT